MWTNDGPNLYWDSEKQQVVEEGDPRARWLLCAHGSQIPLAEAERYGLTVKRKAEAEKSKDDPPPNKLKSEPPANKAKG